jgi:glycosyltransferase involved in cell wall biosynthesis
MRVAITDVQVPFIRGGGELHAQGLKRALIEAGHECELVTMPFRFDPPSEVLRSMHAWAAEDLSRIAGAPPDVVIALRFPAWFAQHPNARVWILHQHRAVYDLWNDAGAEPAQIEMKSTIREADSKRLAQIPEAHRFVNSACVAKRLLQFNQLKATPLYHPPPIAQSLYCAEAQPYIFCPSRLESLKRQDLLIEAMRHVRSPIVALIAGTGGQQHRYAALIEQYGLQDKVRLLGEVDQALMLSLYAHASAVFFGPKDEDLGYVTLEAMLAQKPVITCVDSGGPLEFVIDQQTGFVAEPKPESVATHIEWIANHPVQTKEMGQAGLQRYHSLNITWQNAVQRLLA